MPLLSTSRQLLAYTMWADRTLLVALAGVAEEDLLRAAGISWGSLLGTMAHILGAEQVWLSRFLGAPLDRLPGLDDYPDLPTLSAGFQELWPELGFMMASLTEPQIAAELAWTNTRGEAFSAPFWQPLLHMVNHSTYHRGQVVALMRQLGYSPPGTDLVRYLAQHQS